MDVRFDRPSPCVATQQIGPSTTGSQPRGGGERTVSCPMNENVGLGTTEIRTFLIADVRGYTRFTSEHGDEAGARLAARFAELVREQIESRGGTVVELRGDEALCVFGSPRGALRAAVDLQRRFADELRADPSLPLRVGIGIDAGEAVAVAGGYRAAR